MNKLKSCPFCGKKVEYLRADHKDRMVRNHQFVCYNCNTQIFKSVIGKYISAKDTEQEAITAWNARYEPFEMEWIPVTERLPECDNKYGDEDTLVHMNDGFISTATFVKKENHWELWQDSGEVTHWMPLPEPPKENNHA